MAAIDHFRTNVKRIIEDDPVLNNSEVARRARIDRRDLRRLLDGSRGCTLETAEKIANAIGVKLTDVLEPSVLSTGLVKSMAAMDHFRENVRRHIDLRQLTLSEVSRRSELDRKNLRAILAGKAGCTIVTAERIADAIGTPIHELILPE